VSATLTISGISPARWAAIQAAAAAKGFPVKGNVGGPITGPHGVLVSWDYKGWPGCQPTDLVLTVDADWLIRGKAISELHDLVESVPDPTAPAAPAESSSQ